MLICCSNLLLDVVTGQSDDVTPVFAEGILDDMKLWRGKQPRASMRSVNYFITYLKQYARHMNTFSPTIFGIFFEMPEARSLCWACCVFWD